MANQFNTLKKGAWHSTVYHRRDKWPLDHFLPPLLSIFSQAGETDGGIICICSFTTPLHNFFFLIRWQEPCRSLGEFLFIRTASWRYSRYNPSHQERGCDQQEHVPTRAEDTAGLSWPRGSSTPACRGGNGTRGLWGLVLGNETLLHVFRKRGDHFKPPWRPAGFVCNMPLFPNYVSPNPLASELLTYRHITKHSRTKQQSTK